MADTKKSINLPDPDQMPPKPQPSATPAAPDSPSTTTTVSRPDSPPPEPSGLETKSVVIGVGVLLIAMVVFFFLRGAYANHLVAKRVEPNRANQAGWWLFVLLTSLAAGAIFALADNARFASLLFLGPLGALALISLIFVVVSSRVR